MDPFDDLKFRKEKIKLSGGKKRIDKQHEKGKKTARERLEILFDKGSFIEISPFIKHECTDFGMEKIEAPGEGVVTGYGQIDGRLAYAFSQDFTVVGGTLGKMHAKKILKIMDMALKVGAPIIGINDSGGARIQEGVDALSGYGKIFYKNTIASGVIPQISAIMGPCAGGAVYSPALTDFVFMVKNTSKMFITGPQVIKSVTGEDVSSEELGGANTHNGISGVAHFQYGDDESCIKGIKKLLNYLPSNNMTLAPIEKNNDDINRISYTLKEIIPDKPNKAYDMKDLIRVIADRNDFFESQKYYALNIITGFIRLGGYSVGIIANQPKVLAGCIDINASDKASRFIRVCDSYNIPLLNIIDVPGFLPGVNQEHNGIIRHGAKLLYSYSEATVPKITLIVRKAYGGSYLAMCSKEMGADLVYAWPTAEIAVMGLKGAVDIIFKDEIEQSEDIEKERNKKILEYKEKFASPYIAAEKGYIDDVISPEITRSIIINGLQALINKRDNRPRKKHGNIPL